MVNDSDLQKLLQDEWKYRHEAFFKLVFRYCWYSLVGAVLPSVGSRVKPIENIFPGTADFFSHVSAWYWVFVVLFVVSASVHLTYEYRNMKGFEDRLKTLRGNGAPIRLSWQELKSKYWFVMTLWFVAWASLYATAIVLWWLSKPAPVPVTVSSKPGDKVTVTVTVESKP